MSSLRLTGIKKSLGGNAILRGIDLDVSDNELVVLVGPSGCGKSTLLRTVAGLEVPDEGTISIDARDVTRAAPRERDIAMVFQSYALYPHLTVRENLSFGLRLRGADAQTITSRTKEVTEMLGLGHLLDRLPRQLSGGQRQRVAMGRAIARRPSLFLFDEPLSNLDAALRADVRVEMKRLHSRLREGGQSATMLYVTHDQVEAMTLADRLVVLESGKIAQLGPPLEVYARPRSRFVASFLGSPGMNFLSAKIVDDRVQAEGLDARVDRLVKGSAANGAVLAGVRPHDVRISSRPDADITMRIEVVEAMGFETYAHGRVGTTPFIARLDGEHRVRPGDSIALDIVDEGLRLFDPESELALS